MLISVEPHETCQLREGGGVLDPLSLMNREAVKLVETKCQAKR